MRFRQSRWVSEQGLFETKVHILRRFVHWLTQAKQVAFPTAEDHQLDDLQLRVLELCTRNALKCLHEGFWFLEVVAEVVLEDRLNLTQSFSPRQGQGARPSKLRGPGPRRLLRKACQREKIKQAPKGTGEGTGSAGTHCGQ